MAWPPATKECLPWSYWWWMGSAVDEANVARELSRYGQAGWGGVHIIPIYGAKGYEQKFLPYLSSDWMRMLRFTCQEAENLGMAVDMTTGTGWCFGGPEVTDREACSVAVSRVVTVKEGSELHEKLNRDLLQTVIAFDETGKSEDLTPRVADNGQFDWVAAKGNWQVYIITQKPTSRVKRAAPGGEGYMLNPLFDEAMQHYLRRFETAFAGYEGPRPRAMYHDSFEYGVNWSPDLLKQFAKRRGYRLEDELPALFGTELSDRAARVKADYRETVSDMLIESSIPLWTAWCRSHGFLTRNQAHGSPGNLLDLYQLADIPETEMFNKDRRPVVSKFASSAAHVAGRRLVASETGTWLKEHFTEKLSDIKYLLDDLYLSGVNHVIFHGTCYSPDDAQWPGWLFYASTEMNPRNSIWHDVPALAAYITRCQSVLQSGQPDNELLVYWPIYDNWHDASGMQMNFSVHGAAWCVEKPVGQLGQRLWQRGYGFDFISDRQLQSADAGDSRISVPGGAYRVLVVPHCTHMPAATFEKILALAEGGATVVFEGSLPRDVPGLGDLAKRRGRFQELMKSLEFSDGGGAAQRAQRGKGQLLVGDVESAIAVAGADRETLTDHAGLLCIRRRFDEGRQYFVANRGSEPFNSWLPLAFAAKAVVVMDPMSGKTGAATIRSQSGRTEVLCDLPPGHSVILRAFAQREVTERKWTYRQPEGKASELAGNWQVEFLAGGPALPPGCTIDRLMSWTEFPGDEVKAFAGTARYSLKFNRPSGDAREWSLDLGRLEQSARVRLNGKDLGTLLIPPFRMPVELRDGANLLEIDVTSVSANRIRDLDLKKVVWRNFYDINLVNMDYKPFDASTWPLAECGLLGPVTLQPLRSAN
jgi:hypothetical protein